jgi:CubicO group peptidase (beta-lactamase class C family)
VRVNKFSMRVVLLACVCVTAQASAAPDEERLGKAEGYPVCKVPELGAQRCLVGTLSHMDEVFPSHRVAKGESARPLHRVESAPPLRYRHGGRLLDLDAFLESNRNTGLLVLKGDTIVAERYQYDRKPQNRFQSYSMAKTVVGMLVGLALADGRIASIDDRAEQYVPELKGHPYGETTLRHLLTMSSGVKFTETYDGKDDVAILARNTIFRQGPGGPAALLPFRERARPAGTRFSYASAESEVLGLVVRAAVGKPLAEYLSEKIWKPMGAEADATWIVDAGGYELGYMGLNATLRDWGRLGLLLARYGELDGRQIIPAEWVKAATRPDAPHLRVGYATRYNGYGYQTWLIDEQGRFALLGVRGQAVFVDPLSKVVVVHTAVHASSRDPARGEQFALFYGLIESLKAQ